MGEEETVRADQEEERRVILQFAARQDLMPMRGSKNRGGAVFVFISHQAHVTHPVMHPAIQTEHVSVFRRGPGSLQAGPLGAGLRSDRGWDLRTYPQDAGTLEGTSSISASQKTPPPARRTIPPAQSTLGAHTYEMRLHVNNLQLFTGLNRAILKAQSKRRLQLICLPSRRRFLENKYYHGNKMLVTLRSICKLLWAFDVCSWSWLIFRMCVCFFFKHTFSSNLVFYCTAAESGNSK